jgi:hypothetical protein
VTACGQIDVADRLAALGEDEDAETTVGAAAGREEEHVAPRQPLRRPRRQAERHRCAGPGEECPPVNRRRAH